MAAAGIATAFAYPALAAHSSAASTVTIKVTASEWKFKLSKSSVPVGTTVIFKVTNRGKIAHNFKVNGNKTPLIGPGKTKTLKVVFRKKGKLTYLCTVTGHARLGMTGKFSVGVKPVATTPTTTATTGGGGGATCSTPATTVNVGMVEYAFQLDKTSVPAGCVRFVIKNNGSVRHNFDLQGVHVGAIIDVGQTDIWSVQLTPGSLRYLCDIGEHAEFGMLGRLTVT